MALPALILPALGSLAGWLLAGLAGRIFLSIFTQGAVMAATLYWSGDIADWASRRMLDFIRNSKFMESLQMAFGELGNLPESVLQVWACMGAHEVFVALLSGQIAAIGVSIIARKLL